MQKFLLIQLLNSPTLFIRSYSLLLTNLSTPITKHLDIGSLVAFNGESSRMATAADKGLIFLGVCVCNVKNLNYVYEIVATKLTCQLAKSIPLGKNAGVLLKLFHCSPSTLTIIGQTHRKPDCRISLQPMTWASLRRQWIAKLTQSFRSARFFRLDFSFGGFIHTCITSIDSFDLSYLRRPLRGPRLYHFWSFCREASPAYVFSLVPFLTYPPYTQPRFMVAARKARVSHSLPERSALSLTLLWNP